MTRREWEGPERFAGPVRAEDVAWLRVVHDVDPGAVRRRAVDLAQRIGFDEARSGEVAIVATEVATNLLKHAGEGAVVLRALRGDTDGGVELVALDRGPGVRNLRALVADGASTAGTLGIGLGAVSRLCDSWDAHSVPGHGTVVIATFWGGDQSSGRMVAGLTRTLEGEEECGDAYAFRAAGGRWLALAVDGLGHGPLAARAAQEATRCFLASREESPGRLLSELHRGIAGTRGAAAAVALLDPEQLRLSYAAVGNISGRLIGRGRVRGLVTHPGIVGHNARPVAELVYDLEPESWVVLHSDGLRDRWDVADYPDILAHSPLLVAATLMRDAGVRRDDASVVAMKVASR